MLFKAKSSIQRKKERGIKSGNLHKPTPIYELEKYRIKLEFFHLKQMKNRYQNT